ncbi:MAG: hypothetical protein J7M40_07105 [Planctomycetes bacterium]|nr:hypothetical protein [Planctomycetota bacterium]
MISEKQLEANRKNALHSTGPRTAEGKAVVSGNAIRHGFRSQRIVIDGECADEYNDFRNKLIAWLATEDGQLYACGKWPDDPSHPSPHDSFTAFLNASRESAQSEVPDSKAPSSNVPQPDQAASSPPAETVFTEQTHFDPPTNDPLPAITQPARSLGDVVAADLRGPNTILKLKRYEAHIERSLFRTLAKLERLQEKRLAKEARADEPMDIEPGPILPSRHKSEFLRRAHGRK